LRPNVLARLTFRPAKCVGQSMINIAYVQVRGFWGLGASYKRRLAPDVRLCAEPGCVPVSATHHRRQRGLRQCQQGLEPLFLNGRHELGHPIAGLNLSRRKRAPTIGSRALRQECPPEPPTRINHCAAFDRPRFHEPDGPRWFSSRVQADAVPPMDKMPCGASSCCVCWSARRLGCIDDNASGGEAARIIA